MSSTPSNTAGPAWWSRFWRPETGIFLAFWFFLLATGSRLFRDSGTFWHTMAGEQMLRSGRVLHTDPFSFTPPGQPWVPHQWLAECLMAALHRIGSPDGSPSARGLDALLLAAVTILAGLYTWLAHRLIRAGLHWSLAAVTVALTLLASANNLHIRPHLATMVFLGVTFAWLCDWEAGRCGRGRLYWLVPLFVLWGNLHGGSLGALLTMGLAFAGWGLYRLIGWESPLVGWRSAAFLAALLGACLAAGFVSPHGADLPRTWMAIMTSPVLAENISEHGGLNLAEDGLSVLPLMLLYLAGLALLECRPRVMWLVPLAWLVLAFSRIRHSPLFAVTATLALAELLPHTRLARRLAQSGSDLFQPPGKPVPAGWAVWLLPAAVVAAVCAMPGWARLEVDHWPVELLPELQAIEQSHADGTPIFNEYRDGGFLIYFTPGLRVFIDDRWELYGDDRLLAYVDARTNGAAGYIEACEKRWPFDFALTETRSRFDDYFREAPDWILVKRTATSGLYRRASVSLAP